MVHGDGLILTIAVGLVAAFLGGFIATRLRLPSIVGYLLAGVALGPFTPGFIANPDIAQELAEIGVILLMFGVGIHFSVPDLLAVRGIALPGALIQITLTTLGGTAIALLWGWDLGAGLVLGLAVSVASTVVLLRELAQRDALGTVHGRVAVGWLIVEDLVTVLMLVLLPALAPAFTGATAGLQDAVLAIGLAIGKLAILAILMLVVGQRVIPWLLVQVTYTGSRELFTLAILALALGIAVLAAGVFGASLALGAFLAGLVVGESDLSHQAAADALPLRDAFAVLFFVSVGMLFDPSFLLAEPLKVLAVLALVMLGSSLVALLFIAALGYPLRTGLTVAAGLAQIGEFSFILAEMGLDLHLLPEEGHSIVLAVALISITLNPLVFRTLDPLENWIRRHPRLAMLLERRAGALSRVPSDVAERLRGHAVICGFGRVGSLIAHALDRRRFTYVVIDQNRHAVEDLRRRGVTALYGDCANPTVLEHAGVPQARMLVAAINDPPLTRLIVDQARRLNPRITIVARTSSEPERRYLVEHQVDDVVLAEREVAAEMARYTLHRFGVSGPELLAIVQGLRQSGAEVEA
jgi:CPA2 family monovalent cation:H+ antiporter-2